MSPLKHLVSGLAMLVLAMGITVDILDEAAPPEWTPPAEVYETVTSPQMDAALFAVDPAILAAVEAAQAPRCPEKPLLARRAHAPKHAPIPK
jgi:hypothetical protein